MSIARIVYITFAVAPSLTPTDIISPVNKRCFQAKNFTPYLLNPLILNANTKYIRRISHPIYPTTYLNTSTNYNPLDKMEVSVDL